MMCCCQWTALEEEGAVKELIKCATSGDAFSGSVQAYLKLVSERVAQNLRPNGL